MNSKFDDQERVLTGEQRRFLSGKKDVTDNYKRQLRRRIRNRVADSLRDFHLIQAQLQDGGILKKSDRKQIFTKKIGSIKEASDKRTAWIRSLLAFLYGGLKDQGRRKDTIENVFEEAIRIVERENKDLPPVRDVTVSIEINREEFDLDEIEERFNKAESLDDNELMALLRANRIDGKELEDYLKAEVVEP